MVKFIICNLQVIHDVQFLVTDLMDDYLGDVLRVLESCSAEVLDLVKQSILEAKMSLEECIPALIDTMIEVVVKKSVEVNSNRACYHMFSFVKPFLSFCFLLS